VRIRLAPAFRRPDPGQAFTLAVALCADIAQSSVMENVMKRRSMLLCAWPLVLGRRHNYARMQEVWLDK